MLTRPAELLVRVVAGWWPCEHGTQRSGKWLSSRGGANNTDLGSAPQTGSCAVQSVIDAFAATDRSFASLMREIAASETLAVRSAGR